MNEEHIFQEYIRQNSSLMNQIQELILSLSKSFQGLNTQHHHLAQRVQTSQHTVDLVFYTLLRHNQSLREQLGQTLERAVNPFSEDSAERQDFDSAIASLRAMLKQCQRIAAMPSSSPLRADAPQADGNADLLITPVSAESMPAYLQGLSALLCDAVDGGASLGFWPPLAQESADRHWQDVRGDLEHQRKDLLIAYRAEAVIGAVQLAYVAKPNARHRAEIQKLCVHSQHRRQGLGQRLMQAAEDLARTRGKTLLVLDTRVGDAAERLYVKTGYRKAGEIPGYTQDADGQMHDTVFFYKHIVGAV